MSQNQNVEVTLVVKAAGGGERRYSFAKPRILIGRAPECDVILDEATAGKEHCRLEITPEGATRIVDLGTHVGTLLNGIRVDGQILVQDGDAVVIGQTSLTVGVKRLAEGLTAQAGSRPGANKLERPERPVLHVMQLWGDRILSVSQFEKSKKHLLPGIFLLGGLLAFQSWFCWNFYFELKTLYLAQHLPDYTPPFVSALIVFVLADIAILMMTFDIIKWPRNAQLKSVKIGGGRKDDFFVPEEMLGTPTHELVTLYKGAPAINLDNPNIKGRILLDGQVLTVEELRKTSLVKERQYLPLNYRTRARLEIGETAFLIHLDPYLIGPKGALVQAIDIPMFASVAASFFVVILLLLAVMAAPKSQPIKRLSAVNSRTFKTLVVAAKEKKDLKKEEKKEEKKDEKKEEEKKQEEEEDKLKPEMVETPTNKEQDVNPMEQAPSKEETRVVQQRRTTVKNTLTPPDKNRKSRDLVASKPLGTRSDKNKGVLDTLRKNKISALDSEHGEVMVAPHLTSVGDLAIPSGEGSDDVAFTGKDSAEASDPFNLGRYGQQKAGGDELASVGTTGSVDPSGNPIGGRQRIMGPSLEGLGKGDVKDKLGKPSGPRDRGASVTPATGPGSMSGKLSREHVRQRIIAQIGGIRWCYQTATQKKDVEGKILVSFIISADGTVLKVWQESSDLGAPELESCVLGKLRGFTFGHPEDGGTVTVRSYPFIFRRQ